jgi:hypothetical protein
MMQRMALSVIIVVIFLARGIRFWGLEDSPPGFYVDEAALATHILCVQQTGADAYRVRLPLFSEALGGGLITPTYLYSGVLWTAVFGPSIASFRALIAFYAVLTILGLFILGRTLFLSTQAGLFCALAGAISPWGFPFSRIALVAVFTARRWVGYMAAGVLLALAMYAYPPTRVHVVLLLPFLCYLKLREDRRHWKPLLLAGATWLLVLWPLILGTMRGELQGRFNQLSIMSPAYLHQFGGFSWRLVMRIFLTHLGAHVTPTFLLVSGDANLRHSIQTFGEMSWLDLLAVSTLAIVLLARRRRLGWGHAAIFGFLLWGFLCGIAPAALTQESPHALRAIGAWPFLAMMTGGTLYQVARVWKYTNALSAACAAVFCMLYVGSYFVEYPRRSEIWFDSPVKALAISAAQSGHWHGFVVTLQDYPKLARDYYQMTYGHESCQTARSAP